MSSLLVLSSSTSCSRPCPSPLLFSSRSPSLVSFLLQTRRRCRLRVRASRASESDGFASAGYSKAPSSTLPKSRREILLEYVKNVQPEFMELFIKRAPQPVVDAMRQTVTNMIGTLPPQFFAVTVTTELTSTVVGDVFAMNTFIKRLLAVSDPTQMKMSFLGQQLHQQKRRIYQNLFGVGCSISFSPFSSVKGIIQQQQHQSLHPKLLGSAV